MDPAPRRRRTASTLEPPALPDPLDSGEPPTDADRQLAIRATEDDLDLAEELPTREVARLEPEELAKISLPPPTVQMERIEVDRDTEDELTNPRDLPRGMMRAIRTPPAIDQLALLGGVPTEQRAAVIARFTRRDAMTGGVVLRQGEQGHALIVVVRGRLQIRMERADGQAVTLAYVRDGEFVGEGSLLARSPSPIQVLATEPTELLALAPKDAYEIAGAYPAVWAELKDTAERRAREWDVRLARP